MAYGLRYTADFDALANAPLNFTINIYKNNYVGTADTIMLSSDPAIHEWQDDDPFKAIKGSTLTIGIVNNGDVKLLDFYSDNDNEFYVELLWNATGETLFKGYVLQDDCQEIIVDFAHVISIVATDNLGLLKDVTLGEAAEFAGTPSTKTGILIGYVNPTTFGTTDTRVAVLKPGVQFTIISGAYAGTYTLLSISFNSFTTAYTLVVAETVPSAAAYSADISWNDPLPLDGYVSLLTIIKLCLKITNVTCGLRVMSKIYPVGGATGRWLDDTFILGESFLQNGSYLSCYEVLERIMSRFYASCFQAHGFWYIVRYGETFKIRESSPTAYRFEGYAYDSDFIYQVDYSENIVFTAGSALERFETGLLTSILRPKKIVQETFNYIQPDDLLKNQNIDELGDLINEYTSAGKTIKEYTLKYWYNYDASPGPYPLRYMIVITDTATGIEIERYIMIKGISWDDRRSAQSTDIEISKNDIINFSFDYRTTKSQSGVNIWFGVRLKDSINTIFIQPNGSWGLGANILDVVYPGDNTNQWRTVNVQSDPVPFDGIVNVYLAQACLATVAADETHYKNLRFSITNSVNGLTTITGHIHTQSQFYNLKNDDKKEIYIDNSPRASISGTLFLDDYVGLIRKRCEQWSYHGTVYDFQSLGQLTTGEMIYTRDIAKTKYDGTLLYINDIDRMLSNFQVFYMEGVLYPSGLNWLVPGSVSINYRANNCNITLYEIAYNSDDFYDSWELYFDFLNKKLYEFRYLYEK